MTMQQTWLAFTRGVASLNIAIKSARTFCTRCSNSLNLDNDNDNDNYNDLCAQIYKKQVMAYM